MDSLALAFGAGLMAVGLSILAFLWKARASGAKEQPEAAQISLPGRLDEARARHEERCPGSLPREAR